MTGSPLRVYGSQATAERWYTRAAVKPMRPDAWLTRLTAFRAVNNRFGQSTQKVDSPVCSVTWDVGRKIAKTFSCLPTESLRSGRQKNSYGLRPFPQSPWRTNSQI